MNNRLNDFKDDIDWNVANEQQTPISSNNYDIYQSIADVQDKNNPIKKDIALGRNPAEGESISKHLLSGLLNSAQGISKFLPTIGMDKDIAEKIGYKSPIPEFKDIDFKNMLGIHEPTRGPQKVAELLGEFSLPIPPLAKVVGKGTQLIGSQLGKGFEYLHPEKMTEKFRNELGSGTSSENIENISADVKSKKQAAIDTALIPKNKLFSEHSQDLIYPNKDISKSKYFADEDVDAFYGKKGKIRNLHEKYKEEPLLTNYDALQSALKEQQRSLNRRLKAKTISDLAEAKLDQLNINIHNLDADVGKYVKTLPEKSQSLEKDWRKKYAMGVGPYEDAPLTIRKLAEGKASELSDAQIAKAFTKPTIQTKKILLDLGPETGKRILYSALQKVKPNDAEGLANTIIDLKRTKGYDQFIDKNMENWANNILKQVRTADYIKKGLTSAGGAIAGSAVFGPIGGIVGATVPWSTKLAKILSEKIRK